MKIVILIGLICLAVLFSGCLSESQISAEIEKANYCSADSDCTVVYFGCPFGCGSYVNKNSADYLKKLVTDYQSTHLQCEYKCMMLYLPMCKEGMCVEKICEINKEYDELESKVNEVYYRPCVCPSDFKMIVTEEREIGFNKFKCVTK